MPRKFALSPDTSPVWRDEWAREPVERYAPDARDLLPDAPRKPRQKATQGGKEPKRIATTDFETDPFGGPQAGPVYPFAVGLYDGEIYREHWGKDAPEKLIEWLRAEDEPMIVYAHNGGRFDFKFLIDWIESEVFTIDTRIVKCYVKNHAGKLHELRDSFSILPVPLKDAAAKEKFDYSRMHISQREKHRDDIRRYLKKDCTELFDVVDKHRLVLGPGLTMAQIAIRHLQQSMVEPGEARSKAYDRLTPREDATFRQFYYGGRVEYFKQGIIHGDFKIYDINSSYPYVMANYEHPIGRVWKVGLDYIDANTDFAVIDATSKGALPMRDPKTGGLTFPNGRFVFYATGHEIRMALELGLLTIHKVLSAWECSKRTTFARFVEKFYGWRLRDKDAAKKSRQAGDYSGAEHFDAMVLFWKLVLNSAYGKFAQNPYEFCDIRLIRPFDDAPDEADGWVREEMTPGGKADIWKRKLVLLQDTDNRVKMQLERGFHNVATGASITGAARAHMMFGLYHAVNPIYCDTDSIICDALDTPHDSTQLGAWKLEAQGHTVAIVEKKTYCVFGECAKDAEENYDRIKKYGDDTCVKLASKGVRLTASQVVSAAQGQVVRHVKDAPTFRNDGSQWWQSRSVKMKHVELPSVNKKTRRVASENANRLPTLP